MQALGGGKPVDGRGGLGGFAFAVDGSAACIATAIHTGGNVRDELRPLMAIDAAGRYFEEDPETDTMIRGAPSAVWASTPGANTTSTGRLPMPCRSRLDNSGGPGCTPGSRPGA